jgi:hypothetical protein
MKSIFQKFQDWYIRYPMFVMGWTLTLDAFLIIALKQNDSWAEQGAICGFLGMFSLWLREVDLRILEEPFGGRLLK